MNTAFHNIVARHSKKQPTLNRCTNLTLYRKLRGGIDVTEEMTLGNIGLVMVCVRRFIAKYPEYGYLLPDLQSEGYVALINSINTMASRGSDEGEINNVVAYISWAIYRALKKFSVTSEAFHATQYYLNNGHELQKRSDINIDTFEASDRISAINLRLMIEDCAGDGTDLDIILMRMMGYSDREISELTGLNQSNITRRRHRLYSRFLEISDYQKKTANVSESQHDVGRPFR